LATIGCFCGFCRRRRQEHDGNFTDMANELKTNVVPRRNIGDKATQNDRSGKED